MSDIDILAKKPGRSMQTLGLQMWMHVAAGSLKASGRIGQAVATELWRR